MRHQSAKALVREDIWEPAAVWGPPLPLTSWCAIGALAQASAFCEHFTGAHHWAPALPVNVQFFHAFSIEESRRVSKRHLLEARDGIKKPPHPRKSGASHGTLVNKKADHRVLTGSQPLSPHVQEGSPRGLQASVCTSWRVSSVRYKIDITRHVCKRQSRLPSAGPPLVLAFRAQRGWATGYLAWASCRSGSLAARGLSDQAGSLCCSGVLRG